MLLVTQKHQLIYQDLLLYPSGVICEILNEDGSMARLNNLFEVAKKHKLVIISIKDLINYRPEVRISLIEKKVSIRFTY